MPHCVTLDNSILGPLGLSDHICKVGSVTPFLFTHEVVLRAAREAAWKQKALQTGT